MHILKSTAGRIDEQSPKTTAGARQSGVHEIPAFDVEKIARLRAAIRDGSFAIDVRAIAAKIVAHGG